MIALFQFCVYCQALQIVSSSWKARNSILKLPTPLIADLAIATEKVNLRQPENVYKRICKHFPRIRKIGILGVAYKKNTLVIDESQSIKIAELLLSNGYDVLLFDPLIKSIETNKFQFAQRLEELQSCELVIFPSEFGYLLEGLSTFFQIS